MNRYVLREPVEVTGKPFFAWGIFRKTPDVTLRLEPTEKSGWYWQVNGEDVLIAAHMLENKKRHLVLVHEERILRVVEHLLVLRFSGLDNVRIICDAEWLPYDGCAWSVWHACLPVLQAAGTLEPVGISHMFEVHSENNASAVRLDAGINLHSLDVCISIDYAGMGKENQDYTFPMPMDEFGEFVRAPTQGWPRWFKPVAWFAGTFLGWPHYKAILWPPRSGESTEYALRTFAQHRALDLLGALSVLCPPGKLLVGVVYSHRAGHAKDVEMIHTIDHEFAPPQIIEELVNNCARAKLA